MPVLISGGVLLLIALVAVGVFLFKKPVEFSYAGLSCTPHLTVAPHQMEQTSETSYQVVYRDNIMVFGASVLSLKTCFAPVEEPKVGESTVSVAPFGWPVFAKQFAVQVGSPPVANTQDFISQTLPTTRPVAISLSAADEVYDYHFSVSGKQADCDHESQTLQCDITQLGLAQGEIYNAQLERSFNRGETSLIAEGDFKTLKPLKLTKSSLKNGKVIYDKTKEFSFTYDKAPVLAEAELKAESGVIASTVRREGSTVFVAATDELARNTKFTITLKKVEAADGTALADPYVVNFKTGGGPKVTGVSYGATSIPQAGTIVVQFDQPIAKPEAALKLVSVQGATTEVGIDEDQLQISYQAGLCQNISVAVKKGLENQYGIVQDKDWSYNTRTKCHTTQVIGYSQQGRAIISYVFGSGAKKVLFTGAIHGNESNTKSLLDTWIGELEARATDIPGGTQVVVVPLLNPDGYAAGTRTNSRNVDLNRNFDTTDWKKDIQNVYGQAFPGGGGKSAMSEPETQVIANYTSQLRPALTLSYHSVAGYAIANTCGNSSARASTYASLSGYSNMTGVGGAFDYEITGTYDDWICQRLGLPSVLIELSTSYSSEIDRNRAAMWQMIRS